MGKMTPAHPATVCFPFVGDLVGGSHISVLGLLKGLDRRRFTPLVLVSQTDGTVAHLFEDAGIPVERAPSSPQLAHGRSVGVVVGARLAARTVALARFLRSQNVDIVHSNDGRTHATWALAAKLAGARLLWHHRGAPNAMGLRYAAPLLANRVVAVSRFASPDPGYYSAARRTHVIHSPFDTTERHDRTAARDAIRGELGLPANAALIAFSGALIDRKRPLLFVAALAAMRRARPEAEIHGIMFGESLDDMAERVDREAVRLGVSDRVHVMGFRPCGAFWLAGCDLLMIPAIDEPFGRTLIEAMLVGTPVVATASGGNVEAIRDGASGRLVAPESDVALATACLDLLERPEAARSLADVARAEAITRYGEAAHADAIMALYEDMLAKVPRRVRQGPGQDPRGDALGFR
jgi:glycosyltransferase involved in cell wall biosynthesis